MALRSLEDCAAEADVHIMTLRRLIARGRGPVVTVIGHQLRVADDNWKLWLAEQSTATPPRLSAGGRKARAEASA